MASSSGDQLEPAQMVDAGIPPPEPALTPHEMLLRAEAMRPILRERQAICEEIGRLPEETNQEFLGAGFYRMLQPRRLGGYEFDLRDFIRVMTEVSRGCPESGWVLALTAGHAAAFLPRFEPLTQFEVCGATGDFRGPGVARPMGVAIPVPGGYSVKGAWDFCSGCDIATHFLGCVMIMDPESKAPRAFGFVLCDRKDFSIVDNWDVIGMQGTGSDRVVIENLILPPHRVLEGSDAKPPVRFAAPDRTLFNNPLYHGPWLCLLLCELISVAVGAARGALDIYEQDLRDRKMPFPPFLPRYETPDYQHLFGHLQGLIDTAEAASLELGSIYMESSRRAQDGADASPEEERRFIRIGQQCMDFAWEGVDTMFHSSGTSSARKTSPLGRYFKNLAVIRTHTFSQTHHASTNAARLHFGLPAMGLV
jgi:3-hydroxy-9,10-secoandrosta-1,3,5(10)-triene-9,17-dione monooxygenase